VAAAHPAPAGTGQTIAGALRAAAAALAKAAVPEARRDARVLLEAALAAGPEVTVGDPGRPLGATDAARFRGFIERRRRREPVARIRGRREFWSLPFIVTPAVLDPRPESETVVAAALRHVADRGPRSAILDLGTGSGCLMLALLHELPTAKGLGLDISPAAVIVARRNAEALGLARRAAFVVGSWGEAIAGRFDIVVANPPYIARPAMAGLAPEVVCYDPAIALDGGADGLMAYRALAGCLPRLIRGGGFAVVELGCGQEGAVADLFAQAGLAAVEAVPDLAGHCRVLVLRAGSNQKKIGNRLIPD